MHLADSVVEKAKSFFSRGNDAIQLNAPSPEGVLLQVSMVKDVRKFQNTEFSFVKNRRQDVFMEY
jgi:hypothetical protein